MTAENASTHAMMVRPGHDAREREQFFLSLRGWINGFAEEVVKPRIRSHARDADIPVDVPAAPGQRFEVRRACETDPAYLLWGSMWASSQKLLWNYVGQSVEAQHEKLRQAFRDRQGRVGSLRLSPEMQLPRYLTAKDVHAMPGGYALDRGDDDLRAGAMYDRGGALFQLQANGGVMNDGRGHTMVAFLQDAFAVTSPRRILDLGCTVGNSTVALAQHFPDAEVHAVDASPAMLRYAHARAEALGVPIHFSQQNAEHTDFEDGSFDLVVSHVMLHETSRQALPRILAECHRLLKPGGVMAHLEVPYRYQDMLIDDVIIRDWQSYHNGEPFWGGCCTADFAGLLTTAGFDDQRIGFQPSTRDPADPNRGRFCSTGEPNFRYWFVAGGRRLD